MSPQHQRPVYIPKRRKLAASNGNANANVNTSSNRVADTATTGKRQFQKRQKQQQQPRFHGAFTGGFSAGHFNTVGTKEGWTPSQVKTRDQKLEDFMDDEDHADWGGPTRLREDYGAKVKVAGPATPVSTKTKSTKFSDGDPNNYNNNNDGGAVRSEDEFTTNSKNKNNQVTSFLPLKSMLEISHETVGPRLLRRLGWREGGSAIVPDNTTTTTTTCHSVAKEKEENNDDLAKVHLSKRKLRKIRLQSSRIIALPPPKLDQCGLGFEPYKDAPEFQRYREQRKKEARDRASYNDNARGRNIYRLSDVAAADDDEYDGAAAFGSDRAAASSRHRPHERNTVATTSSGTDYLSFETAEDFVGKRSSAGFALRDDEDDAYDEGGPQISRLKGALKVGDEYNTEVYEHEDSGDEDGGGDEDGDAAYILPKIRTPLSATGASDKQTRLVSSSIDKKKNKAVDAGDMFAVWAGTDPSTKGKKVLSSSSSFSNTRGTTGMKTSDGRAPLTGFVVGGAVDTSKKRYPGPDIPRNYTIQKHEFGEHENPFVLEAISNAVRLEQKEERNLRVHQQQESQRQLQEKSKKADHYTLTKNFSSLADAMKSRFTSSTEESLTNTNMGGSTTKEKSMAFPAGLHMPNAVQEKKDDSTDGGTNPSTSFTNHKQQPEIAIKRTVKSFFPDPLVCKRFRVPISSLNARKSNALIAAESTKNKEAVYFERVILQNAREQKKQFEKATSKDYDAINSVGASELQGNTEEEEGKKGTGIERPCIEKLRSIFGASSDESSSSEDDDDGDESDAAAEGKSKINEDNDSNAIESTIKNDASGAIFENKSPSREKCEDARKDKLETNGEISRSREIVEYRSMPSSRGEEVSSGSSTNGDDDDDDEGESSKGRKRRKERRRRKHDRHRKRHKRKRSRSTDRDRDRDRDYYYDSNESKEEEGGREKERRRRKEKRRRKETHKSSSSSSRHRSRKREKSEEG